MTSLNLFFFPSPPCRFTLLFVMFALTLYNSLHPRSFRFLHTYYRDDSTERIANLSAGVASSEDLRLPINCSTLHEISDLEFLASGRTKAVYRGVFRGTPVAVKTVNLDGQDLRGCQGNTGCYQRTKAKLIRELVLLQELEHENVIKLLGSCVPLGLGPVVIATELGARLDAVKLLQFSWERRIQMVQGVAQLLYHLAHSPLGSLATDMRHGQFVIVNGVLKLTDLEDLSLVEPGCTTDTDCEGLLQANTTDNKVACVDSLCRGLNERLNIWRAGQKFVQHLLPMRACTLLEPKIGHLLDAFRRSGSSAQLLVKTRSLLSGRRPEVKITLKESFSKPIPIDQLVLKPR